jgi:2-oxoglutarate dehydrogenase E1 component
VCTLLLQDFPNAEIYWVQEEPKNQGAWSYVRPRLATALSKSTFHAGKPVTYAL